MLNTTIQVQLQDPNGIASSFLWIIPAAFLIFLYYTNYRYRPNEFIQVK
uniref:Uncharacterized protein n=1 Tax=viral metagenome TaxID=1070528 RepID=A0A6C0APZ1_9ZZZZ